MDINYYFKLAINVIILFVIHVTIKLRDVHFVEINKYMISKITLLYYYYYKIILTLFDSYLFPSDSEINRIVGFVNDIN